MGSPQSHPAGYDVNGKETYRKHGTGGLSQGSRLLEWRLGAETESISKSWGLLLASFQIFDLASTLPQFCGWAFLCHGRKKELHSFQIYALTQVSCLGVLFPNSCWIQTGQQWPVSANVHAGTSTHAVSCWCLLPRVGDMFYRIYYFKLSLNIWFVYSFERERERGGGGAEGEGQADSMLSMKPDARLNPMTLRSWPELKSRIKHSVYWATQACLKLSLDVGEWYRLEVLEERSEYSGKHLALIFPSSLPRKRNRETGAFPHLMVNKQVMWGWSSLGGQFSKQIASQKIWGQVSPPSSSIFFLTGIVKLLNKLRAPNNTWFGWAHNEMERKVEKQ